MSVAHDMGIQIADSLPEWLLPLARAAESGTGLGPRFKRPADLAGQIAGDLDRVGRPIGRCDPMVAAVAIIHGLELVTGNTPHYQRIQQLGYPLTLVNWR